jgi:hypothetical protein
MSSLADLNDEKYNKFTNFSWRRAPEFYKEV